MSVDALYLTAHDQVKMFQCFNEWGDVKFVPFLNGFFGVPKHPVQDRRWFHSEGTQATSDIRRPFPGCHRKILRTSYE